MTERLRSSPPPYVAGALVSGASAHLLDRVLRSPHVRRVVDNLPPWLRVEVESTVKAIRRAAADYEAQPVSSERSDETPTGEVATRLHGGFDGWLDVEQAATLLGISRRRVQQ